MYKRELNSLKRLLAVVLSGAVLLSAGCGSGKADNKENAPGQQTESAGTGDGGLKAENAAEAKNDTVENTDGEASPQEAGAAEENSNEADDANTGFSEEELNSTLDFTYTNHPMTLMNGDTKYAIGNYYTVELEKGVKEKYENLQKVLDDYNLEGEYYIEDFFRTSTDEIKEIFDSGWGLAYEKDRYLYPVRADGRVFSFVMGEYTYLAGAHGVMNFGSYNYDPVTGEEIQFSDVVKNTDNLPEIIVTELEKQNSDLAKSFEDMPSDRENLVNGIPDRYENNAKGLSWAIDYDGIWCYFEDYAMGYYALGAQNVKIKFADYPEIFTDTYNNYKDTEIPDITQIGRELKEEDDVFVDATPYLGASTDSDEEGYGEDWWYHAVVKNPGWSAWTAEGIDTEAGSPRYDLSEVEAKTSDWLNEEKWSAENDIPLPERLPYEDDTFSYSVVNNADGGEMSLTVYNKNTSTLEGNFYFDELNPPDQGDGLFADFTEPEIHYAVARNNILYVSLGHRTYASSNPHKSYMVAIDMLTGETVWRSDDQVCGSCNFVILGDSIYCGYGFTDEPDYIYILNATNGKVQKKIKVKTAPSYFIVQEEYMYVLTYNTAYLYKLVDSLD